MTVYESNGTSIEIVNPNAILFPTRIYPIPKKQIGINTPIKFSVSINHTNSNVQLLSTDTNAIEVDGVLFKIDMPESVLTIPSKLFKAKTDVKLGIYIINNTLTTLCFYQLSSIDAILISDDGKPINWSGDPTKLAWKNNEQNYYLLQPEEKMFLDLHGKLFWYSSQLQFAISSKTRSLNGESGFYYFHNLQAGGLYHLQVIYQVSELRARRLEEKVLEKVWSGRIAMPLVEFRLIKA